MGTALLIAAVWGALNAQSTYWEFALYFYTGSIVFEMLSVSVIGGQDALMNAGGYIKQARIPFLIFQIRVILTGTVIFICALCGLLFLQAVSGVLPPLGPQMFLILAFVPIYILFLIPVAIITSTIGVTFRDFKHISQLGMQTLFMLSPIMLPRAIFERPELRFMEIFDPVLPLLDMFRDPVLYGKFWQVQDVLVISGWTVGLWCVAILVSSSHGRKLVYAI
jgi:ABC-type polysaccharide/polyol phosphate export permease